MVTRKEIAGDLRRLGLRRGDIVELHSSLKSIGRVRGGPGALIGAFKDVLGHGGTLLMPAFAYCLEGRGAAFHPERSSVKTGLVCETFWRMKDVVRSICPTHSVAAWGKRAEEFTRRHPLTSTLGVDSPFHLAARAGGKVMLLGCGHKSNSFLHVVESLTHHPMLYEVVPYAAHALIEQDDGRIKRMELTEYTACSKSFGKIEPYLERRKLIRRGLVGSAPTQVMVGGDVIEKMLPVLMRKAELLLCDPPCRACDLKRANIMKHRRADARRKARKKARRKARKEASKEASAKASR